MLPCRDQFADGICLQGDQLFAVLTVVALGLGVLVEQDAQLAHQVHNLQLTVVVFNCL